MWTRFTVANPPKCSGRYIYHRTLFDSKCANNTTELPQSQLVNLANFMGLAQPGNGQEVEKLPTTLTAFGALLLADAEYTFHCIILSSAEQQ